MKTVELLTRDYTPFTYPLGTLNFSAQNGLVEVLIKKDNKEMSVGRKRQMLLNEAKGEWSIFRDDDDDDYGNYIELILSAINKAPDADCIGTWGRMTTDGEKPETWCHSHKYRTWSSGRDGYTWNRPIMHFFGNRISETQRTVQTY